MSIPPGIYGVPPPPCHGAPQAISAPLPIFAVPPPNIAVPPPNVYVPPPRLPFSAQVVPDISRPPPVPTFVLPVPDVSKLPPRLPSKPSYDKSSSDQYSSFKMHSHTSSSDLYVNVDRNRPETSCRDMGRENCRSSCSPSRSDRSRSSRHSSTMSFDEKKHSKHGSSSHRRERRSPANASDRSFSRLREPESSSRYRDHKSLSHCKTHESFSHLRDHRSLSHYQNKRSPPKYRASRDPHHSRELRSPSHSRSKHSHSRSYTDHHRERSHSRSYTDHHRERSHSGRSPSRASSSRSHGHRKSTTPHPRLTSESTSKEESKGVLTDREKILEEFRRNYCTTSEEVLEKIEQLSKETNVEEPSKTWYRSSPAELYYHQVDGKNVVQQTPKLASVCESFHYQLIERGRKARPEVDELPPLKTQKPKLCKHLLEAKSSSSSESEESLDEDGLQGEADRVMHELQRKQSHPRRLHPEMWFNNTGEMNGGPLCRCSARARRHGMRHGVYSGEQVFPRCNLTQSNVDKLYHYRITVSPPTNFLIKTPTIIGHDEHEFLFSGFSMFSHYKLAKLPTCKVIRFNIEYTILYVEEQVPQNFSIQELDLFEEYLFNELLELVDLDLGKATDTACSQFHFMPRFVRNLPEGGCEVLSMCEVMKYLLNESGELIPREMLPDVHRMDHFTWQKFVDRIKGMIVTYPGKKPCSVRVDQLDRSPPEDKSHKERRSSTRNSFYPEIVHFGIRPPQLSYAGNPEYQRAWRYYVKYRHLIANMAKPSFKDRQKLQAKEARLQEMRTQSKMKRDVTVAISSEGFHTTGLMCDVVQHAMLIPVLVRHLRFHKSLDSLETKLGYQFSIRSLLQTALTHPSYRENFGTNPDHARNSLTNCGIRQPEYGDRRIHYMNTRKKGINTLINIMSRFGKNNETESAIKHNERLEFLGDAVVEFLSSIHLFRMFPGLAEGGLATYRASIVQNQHLAQLAKKIGLDQFMLYAHGSDLCRDVVMRHAMANCFEALMGALFLDGGVEVADKVFSLSLWFNENELLEVWNKERGHPLQEQEPLGDRKYIKDFEFLQKLTSFEESIGVTFKHIRLLARAFTDRSVGFTHLTLGSNQRLEFLGDTVLQLVVSDRLYRHFPEHHEGHLSLLRSSLVNNRTQALVCDDLNMSAYAIYNNPKAKPTTKKHKADLLEAFLGALYVDKGMEYCTAFCNACLFPRLQEFIMNQDWNDPKSKLQQCCLTLRSMEGGEPDIPLYKVIECLGPTNTRVYTVAVYFRSLRLAASRGHSIQEAEMNAAEEALNSAHELFPQLDHQKRVITKSMKGKNEKVPSFHDKIPTTSSECIQMNYDLEYKFRQSVKQKRMANRVPKAYRLDKTSESSAESSAHASSDEAAPQKSSDDEVANKTDSDSGLDSDSATPAVEDIGGARTDNVQVSSLLSDMEKIKEDLIRRNEYHKLKEKNVRSDSDDDV